MFPFVFSGSLPCLFVGVIFLVASLFIFILGATFVGTHILPVLKILSQGAAFICLLVCLPLSFSKKYQIYAGRWLVQLSWIFGITVWFMGIVASYQIWGTMAVIFGLLLMGVGVVPIGALAALWAGETILFGQVLLWSTMALLARTVGDRILSKYQTNRARKTLFNSFHFFRSGNNRTYSFFRQPPKEDTPIDKDIIDAEYEIVEPFKKEIDYSDPS